MEAIKHFHAPNSGKEVTKKLERSFAIPKPDINGLMEILISLVFC